MGYSRRHGLEHHVLKRRKDYRWDAISEALCGSVVLQNVPRSEWPEIQLRLRLQVADSNLHGLVLTRLESFLQVFNQRSLRQHEGRRPWLAVVVGEHDDLPEFLR